jgi:hypothetical protein
MSVYTGQTVVVDFSTHDPATGALADASSTPVGTLVLNGVDNGAAVTVTNKATGIYKASVVMPTLALSDTVCLRMAATVGAVSDAAVIWHDDAGALLATIIDMPGATDKTVSQVLQAMWAQAAGKWAIVGTTLTLYAPDGTTAIAAFTLDSATLPTSRTPVA